MRRYRLLLGLALGSFVSMGCKPKPNGTDSGHHDDSASGDTAFWDSGIGPYDDSDVCGRIATGPGSSDSSLIAWSKAHSDIRLFGLDDSFATVDRALAAAIENPEPFVDPDLAFYADALTEVCALWGDPGATLPTASVVMRGDVAWIYPGTGSVTLPDGTQSVVIDLRDLGEVEGLAEALANAIAPALASPVPGGRRYVREWSGYTDQVLSADNVYSNGTEHLEEPDLAATGTSDLPIALVVGVSVAPTAARFAATLRVNERAVLVGADLPTRIADTRWSPVGYAGLGWTDGLGGTDLERWPEVLVADLPTHDPWTALGDFGAGTIPLVEQTAEPRLTALPARTPWGEPTDVPATMGQMRANLLTVHGTLRRFYPYFDVVGDTLDARLEEVMGRLVSDRRDDFGQLLGRLGESLHDGHNFFGDFQSVPAGYLPVAYDFSGDNTPIVIRSLVPELLPGDAIIAVDGTSIDDLMADWMSWHGAATLGYQRDMAARRLWLMEGTTTYTLRDPDGVVRDATIDPQPVKLFNTLQFAPSIRPSGTLDDLGAPDLTYLNIDGQVETSLSHLEAMIDSATDAGLVVDMRGYPGVDPYALVSDLIHGAYTSPVFRTDVWTGPDVVQTNEELYSTTALGYDGPIVLLVGPTTVSAAENFAIMLVQNPNVTVIGRTSAGTDGNITGLALQAGFYFTFTGMDVRFPDETTFDGVGIVPDFDITPTAADYRDGNDPELEAAVDFLKGT